MGTTLKKLCLASAASLALMGAAQAADSDAQSPAWLSGIADQKLFAVDGSSIVLSPADDKLALALASPAGAQQKKLFALMNDTMGTVSDDTAHVIGFFRVTDNGLDAQFADGHTETLALNGAGGISLATHAANASSCMSWYPSGHVFSEAERRAALAEYAGRLGLSQPVSAKTPRAASSCAMPVQKAATQPAKHHAMEAAASADAPIMVRSSVVHAIDGGLAAPVPAAPPISRISWSPPASAQTQASAEPPAQSGHGASECLSVESDGANLGFRNQCGYHVAFAYCLQTASEQAASCDTGSKTGNVAANAFTPLLFDANIKASDAEHEFRWVACSGDAQDVTAHLDRAEPPAGRCVRAKNS
jgi:hypothetical protein